MHAWMDAWMRSMMEWMHVCMGMGCVCACACACARRKAGGLARALEVAGFGENYGAQRHDTNGHSEPALQAPQARASGTPSPLLRGDIGLLLMTWAGDVKADGGARSRWGPFSTERKKLQCGRTSLWFHFNRTTQGELLCRVKFTSSAPKGGPARNVGGGGGWERPAGQGAIGASWWCLGGVLVPPTRCHAMRSCSGYLSDL